MQLFNHSEDSEDSFRRIFKKNYFTSTVVTVTVAASFLFHLVMTRFPVHVHKQQIRAS